LEREVTISTNDTRKLCIKENDALKGKPKMEIAPAAAASPFSSRFPWLPPYLTLLKEMGLNLAKHRVPISTAIPQFRESQFILHTARTPSESKEAASRVRAGSKRQNWCRRRWIYTESYSAPVAYAAQLMTEIHTQLIRLNKEIR